MILLRRPVPLILVVTAIARLSLSAQTRPVTLDSMMVTSHTREADLARSVDVITRADIERSAAHDVAEVLSAVMGVDVYTRSAAQADVSIRGSSAEQVVILVDGVRMTDVQSAHYAMDLAVPLASIERIEILRGVGSGLYGPDAVGGVINIVTRRSETADARVRTGSFGSVGGALADGIANNRWSLATTADFDKSDGHRDGTDYRIGQGRASLSTPTSGGIVRTNLAIGIRDFGANDFYAPYNSIERTTTTTLDSRWDESLGSWNLTASGSTRRHQDHYVLVRGDPSFYENRHESWQTTGDVVGRDALGPVAVAIGAEGVHDQLSSARLGGRREWRTALFSDVSAGNPAGATANLGLRGDRSSVNGDFFSPSLSASAPLGSSIRLHTSGGTGFRAPTWTERFYTDPSNQGNPDLQPERFSTADAGVRAALGGWRFDATGFVRRATNLIDWVKPVGSPATAVWQATNVGTATFRGIEGTVDLPAFGDFQLSAFGDGLSLTDSNGDGLLGKYALRPITRQAGFRMTTPALHMLTARFDVEAARRAMEDGYVTGNARIAWNVGSYRLTLDALNLANAVWLDASGMPAAGRGLYAGFEWIR